ncbi:MAG: hypothetical protein HKN21_07350 [Candidatus Eisenbacteria bacterium]|uniref:Aminoglycoside phosphotransferase domain-containing protein n=1 Tax=Eiseniibacteriota bacterium TaxID=2212470 RepID=A0A7Y2H219_UNCEI|nr:hypothetical protein [Candidatus Eisenbacteria bacterium]
MQRKSDSPMTVIQSIEDVTPRWLTKVLRESGELADGEVCEVSARSGSGNWSSNARLELRYASGSKGACPKSMFLKLVSTDATMEDHFDDSEVRYYRSDYTGLADAPLLKCFHAAYQPGSYHVLLEDVSETHQPAAFVSPTLAYGKKLAEATAVLHSHYWATLRSIAMPTEAQVLRYIDVAKPGLKNVLEDPKSTLKPHWPELLRRFFVEHPQKLLTRLQFPNGFSRVHGDLNGFNILVPKGREGSIYLIDRQPFEWSLRTWLGVSDLAFPLISDWTPEERREHELEILQCYHEKLRQLGIEDYAWEDVWGDYKLCSAMGIYNAIEFCKHGIDEDMRDRWFSLLTRSIATLEDAGETPRKTH